MGCGPIEVYYADAALENMWADVSWVHNVSPKEIVLMHVYKLHHNDNE